MNTHTLLIWNEFSEGLRIFVIPCLAQNVADTQALGLVHNTYINSAEEITSDQAEAQQYVRACVTKKKEYAPQGLKKLAGRFSPYEVTEINGRLINQLIETGLIP